MRLIKWYIILFLLSPAVLLSQENMPGLEETVSFIKNQLIEEELLFILFAEKTSSGWKKIKEIKRIDLFF